MRYGTVLQFFPAKGFGFIKPDTGPDIFFHVSALGACEEPPEIEPGQPVKYQLEPFSEAKANAKPGQSEPPRRRATTLELLDKLPGGTLEAPRDYPPRHPRSQRRKPRWRR